MKTTMRLDLITSLLGILQSLKLRLQFAVLLAMLLLVVDRSISSWAVTHKTLSHPTCSNFDFFFSDMAAFFLLSAYLVMDVEDERDTGG
jgi:hypothetical protein